VWCGLVAALVMWAASVGTPAAIAFSAAAPILWITGLRAVALWLRARRGARAAVHESCPPLRVGLLYCVADDLDLPAMVASSSQDVEVEVVVLDDSRDAATRAQLDAAAASHGWTVIRRSERRGFKAGNLNHGLSQLRGRFDAYVLCDSDVVLPPDFVARTSPMLADPTVAVVQGQPVARAGRTWFARYFGPLLRTHLAVTRGGREAIGVVTLLGRGALVRAAALDDAGGVPEVVAEDLALTVALRRRGWRLVNVDVAFAEDYPIDYRSFRTQMRKTAEGAVEFLRHHLTAGRLRGLAPREAVDLLFEAILVPVTALAGAVTLIAGAVLAPAHTLPPLWAGIVSAGAAVAPLLPEAVRRASSATPARGVATGGVFLVVAGALYASTMFVVLSAVLRLLLGRRAVFWITPKIAAGRGQLATLLRAELVLVPTLALLAALCAGAPVAAVAPLGAFVLALAFAAPTALAGRPASASRSRRRAPVAARSVGARA
jgi:cellulose synthase/poly-beta-1,6-N-acetylglucosamine synthase-like glycosyltransferase